MPDLYVAGPARRTPREGSRDQEDVGAAGGRVARVAGVGPVAQERRLPRRQQLANARVRLQAQRRQPAHNAAPAAAVLRPPPNQPNTGIIKPQPYHRPTWFISRIICLCILICLTMFVFSSLFLVLPVFIGRNIMSIWNGSTNIHELYTCACGIYTIWTILRFCTMVNKWIPLGWPIFVQRCSLYGKIAFQTLIVVFWVICVIPILLGLLLDFTVLSPIRVPMHESPIYKPWQIWAFGVLHMKLMCILITVTQSMFYRELEHIYVQGIMGMDLNYIMLKLCFPVVRLLTYALTVPYLIAYAVIPYIGISEDSCFICQRYIYPFILSVFACVVTTAFYAKQFKKLYEHIKNEKYLVGKQLVNYDKIAKAMAIKTP